INICPLFANVKKAQKANELYDTILYMWNPTLNEKVNVDYGSTTIETFTSPYIIVPTVLDLLRETFNSNCYLSTSVFDDPYLPLFYSHQHYAVMNHYFY